MGKVWLKNAAGRMIHLPIEEVDDANTPNSAILIRTNAHAFAERCWSDSFEVDHPDYGIFTINLMPANLQGSCNQCGQCCTHPVDQCTHPEGNCGYVYNATHEHHQCQYLTIKNDNKWGQANNTTCSVYATILDVSKACAFPPDVDEIMPWWTSCGFSEIP